MSEEEEQPLETEEAEIVSEAFSIEEQLKENGWYKDGDVHVVPLSKPLKSGSGNLDELRLSEPDGLSFEKLGDPFTILSTSGKISLDGSDKEIKFEVNRRKLNRYTEQSNTPQLGFGEARKLGMQDLKHVHSAMQAFF